ncbi:MAG: HAD-IA family hydrolase [Betaproteobacteria bacterium]
MTDKPAAVRAVLFDLDGTFADTAPDMANALNLVRHERGLDPVPLAALRPHVSNGARGMVAGGFNLKPEDAEYAKLREAVLDKYQAKLCVESRWFDGTEELVDALEQRNIAWGIVTNKATYLAAPLLDALAVTKRAACIVCGDTCAYAKPHPAPLLHAAQLMGIDPSHCLYIGDDERDIIAANAAGMRGVVAMYGYLGVLEPPESWPAFAWINSPGEILGLL